MSDNIKLGEEVDKKIGPYLISNHLSHSRKNFRSGNFWEGKARYPRTNLTKSSHKNSVKKEN